MTIDLDLTSTFRGGGNGTVLRGGTSSPVEFLGGTQSLDRTLVVTTTGSTIFDNSTDLADFDFLCIVAQADALLELNIGATPTKTTLKLKAGVPFVLGSDDATGDFDDALDVIRLINVKAVTGTASVRLVMVT